MLQKPRKSWKVRIRSPKSVKRWPGMAERPLVAVTLAVEVNMGRLDFLAVRVVMRSAPKTKPHQGHYTPSSILIRPFREVYSPPPQI